MKKSSGIAYFIELRMNRLRVLEAFWEIYNFIPVKTVLLIPQVFHYQDPIQHAHSEERALFQSFFIPKQLDLEQTS